MKRYLIRGLPFLLNLGCFLLTPLLGQALGCAVPTKVKSTACLLAGVDFEPLLNGLAWFGLFFWFPALVVSAWLIGHLLAHALPPPFGRNQRR